MYCHFELSTLSSVVETSPEERLDVEAVVFCELELEVLELELDEQAVSNIAEHNKTLVIVEVKYRKNASFGKGFEAVGYSKQQNIIKTTEHYISEKNINRPDAIRINKKKRTNQRINESVWTRRYLRFRNDTPRQDLADFFKWEFAVVFTSILLKFNRIDDFSLFFNKTYFVESWEKTLKPTSFTHFDFYCRNIDEILVKQLNLNKISLKRGRELLLIWDLEISTLISKNS